MKYTKDGKFRHFGFVGFKTEEEAQNAVEHFNNTCIKASRIKVELCAGLGKWHIIDNSLNIFVVITCPCSVNFVFCCRILKTDKSSHLTFILLGGYLNFNAWHMKKRILFEQKKYNIMKYTYTDPFVVVSRCCVLPHTYISILLTVIRDTA